MCMYILLSLHHNLRYCLFLWWRWDKETLFLSFSFFYICPKVRKDKSNRYIGIKRRHFARDKILRALFNASCISLLHMRFVLFPQIGENKRVIDEYYQIIVIWQLQNEISTSHTSVTIWRWTTFFLCFIYIFQMRAQFIVRLLWWVRSSISTPVCWHLTLQTDRPKSVCISFCCVILLLWSELS